MLLPIYQVDAFAARLFEGNPAAVVPLSDWLDDATLMAVAAENNLSETAFFILPPDPDAAIPLRWFTPAAEVDLCGHATLASAFVILTELAPQRSEVTFATRSGSLGVERASHGRLVMDFPALATRAVDLPDIEAALADVLGARPLELRAGTYLLGVYRDAAEIDGLRYDSRLAHVLERAGAWGLVATAPGGPGSGHDFVSRFFAPAKGVPEDPVTGSAHCLLAPYWAGRLGKTRLAAYQASARGGEIGCEVKGERVRLEGGCVLYLKGTIALPDRP